MILLENDPIWRFITTGELPPKPRYDVLKHLPTEKDLSPQDRRKLRHILKKQEEFERR